MSVWVNTLQDCLISHRYYTTISYFYFEWVKVVTSATPRDKFSRDTKGCAAGFDLSMAEEVSDVCYWKVIQSFEGKIVRTIKSGDVTSFCSLLKENGLISSEVKENVVLLHPDISHTRKCRYVLQQVYVAVRNRKSRFKAFLRILLAFPNGKTVKEQMLKKIDKTKHVRNGDRKCMGEDRVFEDKDLGPLYNFLSTYAHKWEDVATLLLRDSNSIQYIKYECLSDSRKCLHKTLQTWLLGEQLSLSPTLKNLNQVLRSDMVQLARIVDNLTDHLKSWDEDLSDNADSTSSSDSEDEDDEPGMRSIIFTELDMKAAVLLELWHMTRGNSDVTYRWHKDKEGLKGNFFTTIKCIALSDIRDEGVYKCTRSDGKSKSASIRIRTPIDDLRQFLSDRYFKTHTVNVDDWPVVKQNTFIKLAVVHENDEFSYKTFFGNDDIFSRKSNIDYISAFNSLTHGDRVLVEGRPGSGKTTLVHKISHDWASQIFTWDHLRLLFVVHLRGFQGDPSIGLKDIIARYYESPAQIEVIMEYAAKHSGLGLGFILDGMDEYQPENVGKTYISKLIDGLALPRALVIVASRPAAVANYKWKAIRIEVLGFFKEDIRKYIESYKFSSQLKCSELMKYLEDHPSVHHMCYLPIQAAMVCFLFDKCWEKIPETETEVYKEFTRQSLLRTLYRYKTDVYLESIFDLQGQEKEYFHSICALAFEKTHSSKQLILQSEVSVLSIKGMHSSLGLITIDVAATRCGFQNVYTFCHLTLQEFLAACYISLLTDEEQLQVIEKYGGMRHMRDVFKFYCGLVKFSDDFVKFRTLLQHSNFDLVTRARISFESQQEGTCDYVAKTNSFDLLDHQYLLVGDLVAIGHVIVHAKKNPVEELKINFYQHEESLEAFVKEIKKGNNFINSITIGHNPWTTSKSAHSPDNLPNKVPIPGKLVTQTSTLINCFKMESLVMKLIYGVEYCIGQYGIGRIAHALENCSLLVSLNLRSNSISDSEVSVLAQKLPVSLTSLDMYNNDISGIGVLVLAEKLPTTNLTLLDIGRNHISDVGVQALVRTLPSSKLTSLYLYNTNITDRGLVALAPRLSRCNLRSLGLGLLNISIPGVRNLVEALQSLTSLSLQDCHISDIGAQALAEGLINNNSLTTLDLTNSRLSCDGACALVESLSHSSLTSLNLSNDYIYDIGAQALAESLPYSSLTSLKLSDNGISDIGVQALAESLPHSSLTSLNLACNSISDIGVQALAESLPNSSLTSLNLACNNISGIGASTLARSLPSTKLKLLKLAGNKISCSGAQALGEGLVNNSSLITLNLRRNGILDDGACALAKGLQKNNCLMLLDLCVNGISDDGAQAFAERLLNNTSLTTLNLCYNCISDYGAHALIKTLKNIKSVKVHSYNVATILLFSEEAAE